MADWYVSSAAWTAIAQFAASTAYTVGQIVRPLTAPAASAQYAFRCTTAGTSSTEPSWPANNSSTVTTGGATFANVTGQSTYGWSAAGGNIWCLSGAGAGSGRYVAGDRIYVSSDHAESSANSYLSMSAAFGLTQVISVNRAGAVPPGAADVLAGAAITSSSGSLTLETNTNMLWHGLTFTSASGQSFFFNSIEEKTTYLKNCSFVFTGSGSAKFQSSNPAKVVLDNTPITFSASGQGIGGSSYPFDMTWINTASAVGGTAPTNLFAGVGVEQLFTLRGVDISAVTGNIVGSLGNNMLGKVLLDSCRIASGVTRYGGSTACSFDEVELVNCYDGTNVINERHVVAGDLVTDRSTYLTSGAADDIGNYSLKLTSGTHSDFFVMPLDAFTFDVENTFTSGSRTATVEIVSSGSLNNNDIRLLLEYMGTSGNPIASFGDSLASVLTTTAALPSSSNTWVSPPSTPQKQLLQVTFSPQRAGRVRGIVRLGKVSTTVWVNPQIAIA